MNLSIKNSSGERIDYSFASGSSVSKKQDWIVLLGHGVTGNKDRPVIADMASALSLAGFDTLRFSYAGNGDSQGNFRNATISKEVGDLNAVLDSVAPSYPNIAYIGHSMGSAVGLIQAARDSRIKAFVSLSGMVDTKTFALTEFGDVIPDKGFMWDEESCPLSSSFMHDLCQTIQSVAPLAPAVSVPWLLLHGTADDVVNPLDSEQIVQLKGDTVKLVSIPDADHSYNQPAHKAQATEAVVSWLSTLA